MYANPAPLTCRAVVAVDVLHFVLTDHYLDVVVSIVSLRRNVYFLAFSSDLTDLVMLSPPLDLLSPLGLRGSAVTSAMLGLLPRFTAAPSDSTETAECLRMLYLMKTVERKGHYRMLINLSLETWRASPPHP